MSLTEGYTLFDITLPSELLTLAREKDFDRLDKFMNEFIKSEISPLLKNYKSFSQIEHILALRSGTDPYEEDGIWHDDGTRVLAFSLSLNVYGAIEGGQLGFRKKESPEILLGPFPPGKLLIFSTGMDGYEHKTFKVLKGERLVCAGWCS